MTNTDPSVRQGATRRFIYWITRGGRLEIAVLLAVFSVAAGLAGFGWLADEVVAGSTRKLDERILLELRQPGNTAVPIGPGWTLQAARDLTAFGSAIGIGLITAIVAGYLALQRRYGLLTFVLSSVASGTILSEVLKQVFDRPRPQIVPHLTDIASASFPSGHSMMSSVVYLTMAALLGRTVPDTKTKVYFISVALLLTVLIGFSRLYLGVHFPSDVLAGWCIGSTWAVICSLAAHAIAQRQLVPRAGELTD